MPPKIAIGVIKVPLPARRAGVIARCGLRIQTELRHEPGTHIVIVEISSDTELRYLNFIGPENLARPANRVVFGMVEIVDIVNVRPNFRRKEFRIHRRFFCARVAGQPGKVRERKGFHCQRFRCAQFALFSGLRVDRSDDIFCWNDIRIDFRR